MLKNEHLIPPIVLDIIKNALNEPYPSVRENYFDRLRAIRAACDSVLEPVVQQKVFKKK